jgi:hypothetical protein
MHDKWLYAKISHRNVGRVPNIQYQVNTGIVSASKFTTSFLAFFSCAHKTKPGQKGSPDALQQQCCLSTALEALSSDSPSLPIRARRVCMRRHAGSCRCYRLVLAAPPHQYRCTGGSCRTGRTCWAHHPAPFWMLLLGFLPLRRMVNLEVVAEEDTFRRRRRGQVICLSSW